MKSGRLGAVVIAAVLVFGLTATPANGEERSVQVEIAGASVCFGDPERVIQLVLPPNAVKIRATPPEGTEFRDELGRPMAFVRAIRGLRDRSTVVDWVVRSRDPCETFAPWSAGTHTFTAAFEVDSRPPYLSSAMAKRAARRLLERKFYWDFLNGRRLSCARASRSARLCRFFGFAGDGSYKGRVRVRLVRKPNGKLSARLHYSAKRRDHYCRAVRKQPWSKCTKRFRGRTRVGL